MIFHGTGSFTYVGCIIYTTNKQNGYSALQYDVLIWNASNFTVFLNNAPTKWQKNEQFPGIKIVGQQRTSTNAFINPIVATPIVE